jgi:excisionase family DNA binding protein
MTIREFARASGLSECTVRKLLKEEKLCYMKIGSRYYIHYAKTMNFLLHDLIAGFIWN